MINFKKPKYVRKYDFIRYFNRPEDEWFWPTQEIIDELQKRSKNKIHSDDVHEEDQNEENEFDFYEYFLEQKTEKKIQDMDQNDPKIIEGLYIDKKAKAFICSKYKQCIVYDFDKIFKSFGNHEEQAHRTLSILKENENVLLFQPTFIFNNMAIAKPDAIVKIGDKITLIETKATSKSKHAHTYDVMYQARIIEQSILNENIGTIADIKLCLVKYELALKGDVTFIFCNKSEIKCNKISSKIKEEKESFPQDLFSKENMAIVQAEKIQSETGIRFIDFYNNTFKALPRGANKAEEIRDVFSDVKMSKIIHELFNAEINESPKFLPLKKYAWTPKKAEHLPELKSYWRTIANFEPMHYSGFVVSYFDQILGLESNVGENESQRWLMDLVKIFLKEGTALTNFVTRKKKDFKWKNFYFNNITLIEYKKLKKNKVYFDFESLNQALRVVDNTPPFMQVVNQVSIIKEENGKFSESNNLLCDPANMTIDFFKVIIDAIIPENNPKDFSYIVYNKGFESSCLKRMANLIGEKEYFNRAKIIVDNIFDLADFFDIRKPQVIVNEKLFGFYSIKKVLPLIQDTDPESFTEARCHDYKKLEQVQQGAQAQSLATRRFFGKISDKEWEVVSHNLKIYCENDVRAMIAIDFFIRKLILKAHTNT